MFVGGYIEVSLSFIDNISKSNIKNKNQFFVISEENKINRKVLAYSRSCKPNLKGASLYNLQLKASYTIEAAFIIPISLFMVVFFLYFFRVMYVQWGINTILNEVAREHAVISIDINEPSGLIITECNMKIKSQERLYQEIVGGLAGLDYSKSEFDKNYIDIKLNYQLKNPVTFFGKRTIDVTSNASSRKWIGYDPLEGENGETYVYVTEYGTAYHSNLTCPYLKPSVSAISKKDLSNKRNISGGKYSSCPLCKGKKNNGIVYVTDYGDVYHSRLNCSALKRTVKRIKLEDASNYHTCQKCAV